MWIRKRLEITTERTTLLARATDEQDIFRSRWLEAWMALDNPYPQSYMRITPPH